MALLALIRVCEGNLLDQDVEVIVNAWNRNTFPWLHLLPQGVLGAIKRRAGLGPFRQLGSVLGKAFSTGVSISSARARNTEYGASAPFK
jgi:O-acetyl-ADP-ribose deacetylase (regulator of RNase III)